MAVQAWLIGIDDAGVVALNKLARCTASGRTVTAVLARWLSVVEVVLMILLGIGLRRPRAAARMLTAVGTVYVACEMAGALWARKRPVARVPQIAILTAHGVDRSFPSRHVASGLAMAAIGGSEHPTLGRTMCGAAWLLGLTRVMAGLHYPSDVLAAAVLARIVTRMLV